jgi:hypothetical protein
LAARLLKVYVHYPATEGTQSEKPSGKAIADGLIAVTDLDDDGRRIVHLFLPFATYTSLEAEWELNTGTTQLNSAWGTELAAFADPGDPDIGTQYEGYLKTSKAWP